MAFERARFAASAEAAKDGITLLVPRPVVDAECQEFMGYLTGGKVQNLIVFLRRGGLRHLDINDRLKKGEYRGFCPLHVAVMRATSSVVSAVLELGGAQTDVKAKTGETPLHLAARQGEVGMTRALLQYGATVDITDAKHCTPLIVCASAAASNKTFHHLVAAELVKGGASLIARDGNGDTPLHLASDTPLALELVQQMTKEGTARVSARLIDAIEALNINGEGVLHRACARKQAAVARVLLSAGARSDARSASGDTAMHCAARAGLEEIAMHVLENPEISLNVSNLAGETPLHLAMSANTKQHARIARVLLARGAFAFGRTRNGESVLHACAREGNVALAALILSRQTQATADALNCRANNGGTPLHVAVACKQGAIVQLFLSREDIDRGLIDDEGNTAIHVACHLGDLTLLEQLLKAGRGVKEEELRVRNALGWAALHTSAFHGHTNAVRLLLSWRSPPDVRTADGWTALHLACAEGHVQVARTLLASGAQLDAQHPNGEAALGIAASRGRHEIVKELLRSGAEPGGPADENGWTPMHAALKNGAEDVALALLEQGGRIRSRKDANIPKVGDPIDLAQVDLRGLLLDADERRRRNNRLAGRDSDDGEDWELDKQEPRLLHWPAVRARTLLPLCPARNVTHIDSRVCMCHERSRRASRSS